MQKMPIAVTVGLALNSIALFLMFAPGIIHLLFFLSGKISGQPPIPATMRAAGVFIAAALLFEAGLPVFFLFKIAAGRNWARWSYAIFWLALLVLFATTLRSPAISHHFYAMFPAITIIGTAMFFMPRSNRWFRANRT